MQLSPYAVEARMRERGNAVAVLCAVLAALVVAMWLSWSMADTPELGVGDATGVASSEAADASLPQESNEERARRAEDATFAKDSAAAVDEKPFVRTRHHVPVRVIDARTREPIEGAEVVAEPFDETPAEEEAREMALRNVSPFAVHLRCGQKEKTDAAGRAWIRLRRAGLVFAHKDQWFGSVEVDFDELGQQGIEIRMSPSRTVTVRVLGPDGAPRAGVPLGLSASFSQGEMHDEVEDSILGETDEHGVLLVRPEEHLGSGTPPSVLDVYVRAPGLLVARSSIANGVTDASIRLPAYGSVRLRVQSFDGKPLADAPHWLSWIAGQDESDTPPGVGHATAAGRSGVAVFPYVGLGLSLGVSINCGMFASWSQVAGPTAANQEVVHDVVCATPGSFVARARLLDADGQPLSNRRVRIVSDSGYGSSANTDADGRMSCRIHGDDDEPKPFTFTMLVMERGKSLHAFEAVTALPGRENDFGDLRATAVEVIATGKFEADAPLQPGIRCWTEVAGNRGWSHHRSLFVHVFDDTDSFVVCRIGELRPSRMRLKVDARGFLDVEPIEFSSGSSLVVPLRRGARFEARVLLDPSISWLVERSNLDLAVENETGHSQMLHSKFVDGEWRFESSAIAPGVYSLSLESGNASDDLAQLAGVRIGIDEPKDPRLQPWDLRSTVQLMTIRLRKSDGSRFTGLGSVYRRRAIDGEWEGGASFENGVAQFLGNTSPADLVLAVEDHPLIRRTGVIGSLDVVVPDLVDVRIVFDDVAPIATAARVQVEVAEGWSEAQGLPDWSSPAAAFDWRCEEAAVVAKLTPPVDFSMRVFCVKGEEEQEELGVVPVSVRDGQKEVRVAVPPALRAALAQFAKPGAVPAPAPSAPTSGGR